MKKSIRRTLDKIVLSETYFWISCLWVLPAVFIADAAINTYGTMMMRYNRSVKGRTYWRP